MSLSLPILKKKNSKSSQTHLSLKKKILTVKVLGYLIFISIDFYDSVSRFYRYSFSFD